MTILSEQENNFIDNVQGRHINSRFNNKLREYIVEIAQNNWFIVHVTTTNLIFK